MEESGDGGGEGGGGDVTAAVAPVIGIVLAAGAGVRMGGPKALLVIGGEPLARAHARRMKEAGCGEVVIVTRAELVERFGGGEVVVASGAEDPAGSLAIGLAAVEDEDAIAVVTPVDALPAKVETIEALVGAVAGGAEAATPVFAGRGGHPVAIRLRAVRGVGGGGAKRATLRDVLAGLGARRVRVEVEDAGVGVDLDTPEDVERVTGERVKFA